MVDFRFCEDEFWGVHQRRWRGQAEKTAYFTLLPSLPSAVAEWLVPTAWGAISVVLIMNWTATQASEARGNQRI